MPPNSTDDSQTKAAEGHQPAASSISSRGMSALTPPLPYLGAFFNALSNPCDASTNPGGIIALCVAENKLIVKDLSKRLIEKAQMAEVAFGHEDVYCYNDMRGMMFAREAVARFLTRKFLKAEKNVGDGNVGGQDLVAQQRVDPNNVILGSGCAGLLNGLFFSIAEAGDAVLIPSPYYAAFESDMKVIAQCVPHQVPMEHPGQGPTMHDLESSWGKAVEKGLKPKILLLTNPNNPLGTVYSKEIIASAVDWARGKGMHIIVDEIYGLSIHDANDTNFQSIMKILDNNLGNDVHFLWALSKDFGSSGFRVGVLYTQNQSLNSAIGNLNIFAAVSHPMQAVVANLLDDEVFVDELLDTSRGLVSQSYGIVTGALEELNIPYVKAQAGIFVHADFSSLLEEATFESEDKFASLVIENARIVMTPGHCQRESKPGWFRICYAWVQADVLELAMARLKRLILDLKENGWEDKGIGQRNYFDFTRIEQL